jgi:AcrR family transcriptional regulator
MAARRATLDAPVGASALSRTQVEEIQRARLVAAAIAVIDEHGWQNTTVARITARARVSRRTFYELFENCETCLAAAVRGVVEELERELAEDRARVAGGGRRASWSERVRGGLWAILCFLESEAVPARLLVVHSAQGGPAVAAVREHALARLVLAVDGGRSGGPRERELTPLTAEGLVGAALAVVHARLARREREPLTSLLGELTALIVLPYRGAAAARREQARPVPAPPPRPARTPALPSARADVDPLQGLRMRLTYRTARVLHAIGELQREHGGPSNREVADRAGIADQGQVSKLLARLQRLELLTNRGSGHLHGEANAWQLTPRGQHVAHAIEVRSARERQAA